MNIFTEMASSHPTVLKLVSADADPRGGRVTLGSEVIDGLHPWAIIRPFKDSGLSEGVHLYRKGLAFHDDGQPVATEAGYVWQVSNGGQGRTLTVEDSQSVLGSTVSLTDPGLTYYEAFDAQDILDRGDGYFEAGEYGLDCQGDIELHYQPPLTAEQIAEGHQRPIEIDGGYVAYHASKRNNSLCHDGSPKRTYMTGKVGNIFRPFADCYGPQNIYLGRVWGKWDVRGLSWFKLIPVAEIPQGTTRIEVDATLGYTTDGGSVAYFGYTFIINQVSGISTEGGTVNSISIAIGGNILASRIKYGLYKGAGGFNGNESLIEQGTYGQTADSVSGNWYTWNSNSSPVFASGDGVFPSLASGNATRNATKYDSLASNSWQVTTSYDPSLGGSFPDPVGSGNTRGYVLSKYVTYTPAAPAGASIAVLASHHRNMMTRQ